MFLLFLKAYGRLFSYANEGADLKPSLMVLQLDSTFSRISTSFWSFKLFRLFGMLSMIKLDVKHMIEVAQPATDMLPQLLNGWGKVIPQGPEAGHKGDRT